MVIIALDDNNCDDDDARDNAAVKDNGDDVGYDDDAGVNEGLQEPASDELDDALPGET